MAKVLDTLPAGLSVGPPKTSVPSEASSGAPKARSGRMKGDTKGQAPKALRRPGNASGGWLNTSEGLDWQARRSEAFGYAASRYFKNRGEV